MASLQQVLDALVGEARAAIAGVHLPATVYAGWPTQQNLAEVVARGIQSHVSVYALPGERNTTRFPRDPAARPGAAELVALLRQQEKHFMVSVWAPAPDVREVLAEAAVATKTALGIDDWHFTPIKDFVSFFDSENNQVRTVTPLGTVLGLLCNQSPEQNPGNKPLQGLLGTERTMAGIPYSKAESDLLTNAGINFVTNPIPRGAFFGLRHGLNSSTDATVNGINYTRMTNFLAYSLAAKLGAFVEELQSTRADDPTRRKAENAITSFLERLKTPASPDGLGMIDGYSVKMDLSNNSPESIGQGYLIGYGKVAYLSIVRWFLFYLEGGQTVAVPSASQP